MARRDLAHPANKNGPWFVDTRCIRCDAARHWAPELIGTDEQGRSFVARQPANLDEEAELERAAAACPTQSIASAEQRRPAEPPFPFRLTDGVYALGHNSRSSFGAHSYLIPRHDGNLMTDSPRFGRGLAERIDDLGGLQHVLLTHRDDVADADRWADRFGANVWIHEADADAAPYATNILEGADRAKISKGVTAIHAPGHTAGHLVFHVDDRWLFTGDALHWNHRRGELDVFPEQTFQSWDVLANTMDNLAGLRVEWVFPGHGSWRNVGEEVWARQMAGLGPAMRRLGQATWAQRPNAAYYWY